MKFSRAVRGCIRAVKSVLCGRTEPFTKMSVGEILRSGTAQKFAESSNPSSEQDWKNSYTFCATLSDAIENFGNPSLSTLFTVSSITPYMNNILQSVKSERTQLSVSACRLTGILPRLLGEDSHIWVDRCIWTLLEHCGSTKAIAQKTSALAINNLITQSGYNKTIIASVCGIYDEKPIPPKIYGAEWIKMIIKQYGNQLTSRELRTMAVAITRGLECADNTVRTKFRDTYWVYQGLDSEGAETILPNLNSHARSALLAHGNPKAASALKEQKKPVEAEKSIAQLRQQAKQRLQERSAESEKSTTTNAGSSTATPSVAAVAASRAATSGSQNSQNSQNSRPLLSAPVRRPRVVATPINSSQSSSRPSSRVGQNQGHTHKTSKDMTHAKVDKDSEDWAPAVPIAEFEHRQRAAPTQEIKTTPQREDSPVLVVKKALSTIHSVGTVRSIDTTNTVVSDASFKPFEPESLHMKAASNSSENIKPYLNFCMSDDPRKEFLKYLEQLQNDAVSRRGLHWLRTAFDHAVWSDPKKLLSNRMIQTQDEFDLLMYEFIRRLKHCASVAPDKKADWGQDPHDQRNAIYFMIRRFYKTFNVSWMDRWEQQIIDCLLESRLAVESGCRTDREKLDAEKAISHIQSISYCIGDPDSLERVDYIINEALPNLQRKHVTKEVVPNGEDASTVLVETTIIVLTALLYRQMQAHRSLDEANEKILLKFLAEQLSTENQYIKRYAVQFARTLFQAVSVEENFWASFEREDTQNLLQYYLAGVTR